MKPRPRDDHRGWVKPLGTMLTRRMALVLALAPPAAAHNGYSFSGTGGTQMAGTRVAVLNSTDPEIMKFANGFSMTLWARFNDLSPIRTQIPWSINTQVQDNFMQGFAGMEGGYMFGGAAPQIVSTLPGDSARDWHHYAVAWDHSEAKIYLDGAEVHTSEQTADINWWKEQAYIIVGCSGYNDR